MTLTPGEAKQVQALLHSAKKIVIITHASPDGDAMGSSLGLYHLLLHQVHHVRVITPDESPAFLSWLPGSKEVIVFSLAPAEAGKHIAEADIIFCLDFNSLKRINDVGPLVEQAKAVKINIDHHPQPDQFASFMLHDTTASSTAELVYDFIGLLNEQSKIDKAVASCIYTGIITDTGSFRFPSTRPKTHRIAAELMEAGAENAVVYNAIYDNNTEDKIRLLGYCLSEKLQVLHEYHTAYIGLAPDELKKFNFKKGDTEGLVNYPLSIQHIRFSAFFMEREGIIKTSFRSKGNFDVNAFARKYFEGGGHVNAAGGFSRLPLKATVEKFLAALDENKHLLEET